MPVPHRVLIASALNFLRIIMVKIIIFTIFKTDATSHSRGEEVWSQRIKNSFNMRVVPKDVVALAHRIVDEEDDIDFKTEPSELVQLINTNMLEGGYIDQLFEE